MSDYNTYIARLESILAQKLVLEELERLTRIARSCLAEIQYKTHIPRLAYMDSRGLAETMTEATKRHCERELKHKSKKED